ncbi:MAG TPA: hypothetical protein VN047_05690 [Sphingopyxis sp.]|uniref:hypothetical protein n=1 Tax=Sphingopyxis sp. TaxID=1908224 RepID=UPI002CFCBE3D|nr:hypothetical protein [Sphingopyxis sp.]HWW56366.1 hypothetical protein [Sphingopyxis sp.]
MAERIDIRGTPFVRFECECGQRQQTPERTPEALEKFGPVKCARCGKEHTVDG